MMEPSKSTENLAEKKRGNANPILLIVAVVALVISVVAFIIAVVSIGKDKSSNIVLTPDLMGPGGSPDASAGSGSNDGKIWQFAFEHVGRTAYIDEATGELRGFHVDLVNTICQIARKNCQTVFDTPQRCWDSITGTKPEGGVGLMAGYYDACVGWIKTYERPRTFKFTDAHSIPIVSVFLVKKGNTDFNWEDLTNSVIGVVDGWAYDEHCIARETDRIVGAELSTNQTKFYSPGRQALYDGLIAGEVDAIFDYKLSWAALDPETDIASDDITSCFLDGAGLMMRKDNGLDAWWNPALASLMATSQWKSLCNDIKDEHGHNSGPEPEEFCLNL